MPQLGNIYTPPSTAPIQDPNNPAISYAQPTVQPTPTTYGNTSNGGGGSPSILGTGAYQGGPINISTQAFQNPLGAQAASQLGTQLNNYLPNTTQAVNAAQAGYGSQAQQLQGVNGEQALANQYGQMAAGGGPSAATVAAGQQGAANLSSAESMLGSARGAGNPAAAQLAARNAQAMGANQVAQNTVAGKTQEELAALGAQGGLYSNIAGQGAQEQALQAGINQSNASQMNQVGLGNQQNMLAANTNFLGALGTQNAQTQAGQEAGQTLSANTQLGQEQIQMQAYENAAKQNSGLLGGITGAAGGAFATLGKAGLL